MLDDWELILLLVEVLAASCCALADGCCLLDLRLSTGAVRIAALAACASAPSGCSTAGTDSCTL